MSYDLFLKPQNSNTVVDDFISYFGGRQNYSLNGLQAWYENEETGVYFSFDIQEDDAEEEYYPYFFNMNYVRPTCFIKEAEPEVRAFIEAFDLIVYDPQTKGMGRGAYQSDKFISGWLHGNEFGYQVVLEDCPKVHTLPTAQIATTWAWNFNREKLQANVTDDIFVPSILLLDYQGQVMTACVWGDAIPSIIPPVDMLLIPREELAPRKLFSRRKKDTVMVTWENIQPLLDKHKSKMQDDAYYLSYQTVPAQIKNQIQKLKYFDISDLKIISLSDVLDEELVEKYRAN